MAWVLTQDKSFLQTLNEGGRAFDIRLAPYSDNELKIVHSSYDTNLYFANDFLTDCRNFLDQHPKEVLIARIQRDDGDIEVVKNVLAAILNHPDWNDLIYIPTSTTEYPRLDEVRGKLVLIYDDKIYDERALGYRLDYLNDTSSYLYSNPATPDLKWLIHDNYNATDPDMKKRHVSVFWDELLSSYQQDNVMPLLFLNAVHLRNTPRDFAVEVNPWFTKKIADLGKSDRLGVVFSDFFDSNMSYILIAQNYRKYNINP